jgi:hypothetical protein
MPEWLAGFSREYYVPLVDYKRDGGGLLVGSGCGVMMAAMDALPQFRWCVDIDNIRDTSRFWRWLPWAESFASRVAVVGWFSITDPTVLRQAIGGMKRRPLAYTPGTDLGAEHCPTLEEFLRRCGE